MKKLSIIVPLLLLAWPAWSTSCIDESQNGEYFELELVAVTVDRERIDDLSAYDGYEVWVSNEVDEYETDGLTQTVEFGAYRYEYEFTPNEREQREWLEEIYPVADRSVVGE